jgi:uncharacterized protein (TIGR02391 family)
MTSRLGQRALPRVLACILCPVDAIDKGKLLRLQRSIRSALDSVPASQAAVGAKAMVSAYERLRAEARNVILDTDRQEFERLFPETIERPTSYPGGRLGFEGVKFNTSRALLGTLASWLGDYAQDVDGAVAPSVDQLHPLVLAAAGGLYGDRHYSQAVFEACKAIEERVRDMSELDLSGRDLMTKAFSGTPEPINLRHESGRSGEDEQEGFRFLFMGMVQGIRNPKGHGLIQSEDPVRAFEYLSFLSLLMRRLDDAAK